MKKKVVRRALLVALLAAVLFAGGSPALASGNPWYDKYIALESDIRDLYYDSNDSALLAWQESYLLRSYINLYQLTRDTDWLDLFTAHADTMLANADDFDGDGYLGWQTYRYSPNLMKNGTFATADAGDPTLPAQWTRFQATSATAYRSNAAGDYDPSGGDTWGLVLRTDGNSWQKLYQGLSYKPNTKYRIQFSARTNNTSANGRLYVHDRTTNTIIANLYFNNTSWKTYTLDFLAPSAPGHTLEIWLGHSSYQITGFVAYFDNISLNGWFPYLVHDGMIGVPLAEFVRLVDQNPSTLSSYPAKADTYRNFIENELVPKWENSSYLGNAWVNAGSSAGFYREPPNVDSFASATLLSPLPYNQYLAFAELLTIMYEVNGNAAYLDRATKMHMHFKNGLTTSGSAYVWRYAGYANTIEDTSHGNVDISAVIEMYNGGHVYTLADMDKFTDTLTTKVWNQSMTAPKLHNYVNGTKGNQTADYMYTTNMSGWIKLVQFDPLVWHLAAEQYRTYTPTKHYEALVLSEIMKWDPVKLVNQGFEFQSAADATLPLRWARFQATPATAYRDPANKTAGNYGVTIVGNGTKWQKLYQVWEQYEPSADYVLTFDGKTDGSPAGGKVWVLNETKGTTIAAYEFTNTDWETHALPFTAPANGTDVVKIYLGHKVYTVSGGKAHFDNVAIRKAGDAW
jgi:hypothetical protein